MEVLCLVITITGLNRLNTWQEDDCVYGVSPYMYEILLIIYIKLKVMLFCILYKTSYHSLKKLN
jgi:hypothetical protein